MRRFFKLSNKGFASKIKAVKGREVLDSRGFPTVEADVVTDLGTYRAIVPSGASTGKYEALELRDKDKRYKGKGVLNAVDNVNKILAPALVGMNVEEQFKIDKLMVQELDGSRNEYGWVKTKLGANAILPVSMAIARAGAASAKLPLYKYLAELSGNGNQDDFLLPLPSFNVINGGKHAGNKLAFQEFMLMPVGANSFREAMQMGSETYHTLKAIISKEYGSGNTSVGDEGGFAPDINNEKEACKLLQRAIKEAGYEGKLGIALDVAASEFWNEDKQIYNLSFKDQIERHLSKDEMLNLYKDLVKEFPIISIEDPFDENDFELFSKLNKDIGDKVQIVGDDLLVTNPSRIHMAIDSKSCNALLLKVNQIGSLYESIDACNLAQNNKWGVMVSHRSGETEDNFIGDLAVGLRAGQIKSGAPCRSERTAKYNQLMRIEEEVGDKSKYAGSMFKEALKRL